MYRKRADQLIVQDVRRRLSEMADPDWLRAVVASAGAHPEWYRHHQDKHFLDVGQLLEAEGIKLVEAQHREWEGSEAGPDQG